MTLVPGIEVCVLLPQVERGDKDILVNKVSEVGKYKPYLRASLSIEIAREKKSGMRKIRKLVSTNTDM